MPASESTNTAADIRLAPDALRDGLALLRRHPMEHPAYDDAVELLERDLLPRSSTGEPYLVCGIVGPNNAGKSALFNAIVGEDVSPSEPTGGATRRLVGAAPAALLARLRENPHLSRFRIQEPQGSGTVRVALASAASPGDLISVTANQLPEHLFLIDTPDFDSIHADNRAASESLLSVADVVIAVVTRHSYQNRAVVDFFREWLRHGRPWLLVYNEAIDESVAAQHCAKLIGDIGARPMATYWAPHDLEVQRGARPLTVQRLEVGQQADADGFAGSLTELLLEASHAREVKARAFDASLGRLRDAIQALGDAIDLQTEQSDQIRAHAEGLAREAGRAVAARAMPAAPFVEAFRVVLDRRTNVVSRNWRSLVRGVRVGLERIPALWRRSDGPADDSVDLQGIELQSLAAGWPPFWEELARDLGDEARLPARRQCAPGIAEALGADLAAAADDKLAAAQARLRERDADFERFQLACEELIDEAIDKRGYDIDIQAAADLATLAPVALAAVVIVSTSGVGLDLAAVGGGAISTFIMEKYSHLLGSSITRSARGRWSHARGDEIAEVLLEAALPTAMEALRSKSTSTRELQAALERFEGRLPAR